MEHSRNFSGPSQQGGTLPTTPERRHCTVYGTTREREGSRNMEQIDALLPTTYLSNQYLVIVIVVINHLIACSIFNLLSVSVLRSNKI